MATSKLVYRKRPDGGDEGQGGAAAADAAVEATGTGQSSSNLPIPLPVTLSERWRKWVVRTITTWTLIGIFSLIVQQGPIAISVSIVLLQMVAFREVVNIGYLWNVEKQLPLFRVQQWYFLLVAFYAVYGKGTQLYLLPMMGEVVPGFGWTLNHHSFVAFCGWVCGFVVFVVSLRKGSYKYQVAQFAWTHMCLLLVILPNIFVIRNTFNGLFWFLLPSTLIFVNDITAYMWGFHFGRTPLIQLSPKKTWEGFIGGGLCTLIWGFVFPAWLVSHEWLICPRAIESCTLNPVFTPTAYELQSALAASILAKLGFTVVGTAVVLIPVQLHGLALAFFASVIAPFGGFFASGVKRAYNLKDFANLLPGHGGIIDRVDCQFLMATFTYMWYINFINKYDLSLPDLIVQLQSLSEGEIAEVCAQIRCAAP
ncbi:phosphatidate cytidylyltransferase [Thecamonas trahens ATCC 50062]|uniref:Phosphatidate cytidylyltransferase n=1 Tax=Thecamonas trahens ATCC 50062 TaxID=461836 RepID=A0A0L0DHZ7_THETB|nr:phosphatidate cytidylyltransferase [Thecamonas trahens ATCC 50062]KNC50923.1 phosphatidate cytidylyltransferase [Thecamonas trahens ATCC 50062]|eukprot:XP_013756623.1 phosphatidate cytidylyltransferase [Thecamonas trahens ATCC 50062]